MAIIKKSEMKKMSAAEVDKKLQELEMSLVKLT
jgi:ribosomal protein L29